MQDINTSTSALNHAVRETLAGWGFSDQFAGYMADFSSLFLIFLIYLILWVKIDRRYISPMFRDQLGKK